MWGINIYKGRTVKWPLGSLQFILNQPTGLPGLKDDHNPAPTYQPKRTQPSKLLIFSVVLTWKPLLPPSLRMQRNLYSTCFQKAPLESVRACTMHKSEGDQQGLECVLELSTRGPAAIPLQFDSLSSSQAQYMRFSHRTEVHAAWSVNLSLSCI